jgi:hypothetical protein
MYCIQQRGREPRLVSQSSYQGRWKLHTVAVSAATSTMTPQRSKYVTSAYSVQKAKSVPTVSSPPPAGIT